MNILATVLIVIVALSGIAIAVRIQLKSRRQLEALSPTELKALERAKAARQRLKRAEHDHRQRVSGATKVLNTLQDPKGRRLASLGGATLYERWIDTPQGSGSIIGVHAEAADESSVRQRLTATRLVTLGVFSLAAPKKTGVGNAYVVINGPSVSGVATVSAQSNKNAGPDAYSFAAQINNAARVEDANAPSRPALINQAQSALNAANSHPEIQLARAEYSAALADVPAAFRARFPHQP